MFSMLFALDAHAIGRHLTGNEVYARNLLNSLLSLGSEARFLAYLSLEDAQIEGNCRVRRVPMNPFLRLGLDFAMKLRRDKPDLLHVQYTAPLACPVPVVVSVHDVSFQEHPEYFSFSRAAQLRWSVRRTVERAARVLTGSEFSRASILRVYPGLDPENVIAVPNAAAACFRPLRREPAAARARAKFGLAKPFLLTVGDLQPRKNHIGLIEGFRRLLRACPQLPHDLVLAGKDTWFSGRVREAARASGVGERIRFTGFVTDEDLLHLYNACDVFVFPSFYEGFGLPLLEAMACARAVACSNTTAMPEVADGAAILFNPRSADDIARALADLLRDAELRARMERLGLQRSAGFSWARTAAATLRVYEEVVGARPAARRYSPAHAVNP
jgi:glycosyltransferase involved in cell wall biosynthesis